MFVVVAVSGDDLPEAFGPFYSVEGAELFVLDYANAFGESGQSLIVTRLTLPGDVIIGRDAE